MKKNLLITLLVFTAFSTMFARYDSTTGTGLLGAGAPVNPGVGPVITGDNVSGKTMNVPARVAKRYAEVLQDGQMSCSKVKVSSTSGLVHFNNADQQKAYDRALRDLQKYYGYGTAQANCYALIYANSVN
ncbi:hypothetical protein EBU24_05030 [bacterium]|nr:hypothetical protein [bacterium]